MKHPSIQRRLVLGSTILVAIVLLAGTVLIDLTIEKSLREELDARLLHEAILLSKSAELVSAGVIYEWEEALKSTSGPPLSGLFQFWDLATGETTRSPELGQRDLPTFRGALHQPVIRDIILPDGQPGRAIGLLHHPFTNPFAVEGMKRRGKILHIEDYPQILVCARDTTELHNQLMTTRLQLAGSGLAALGAVCGAIILVSRWSLRPIQELTGNLLARSTETGVPLPEIPTALPRELVGLATAFNTALERVETARNHEKDFALSAAHELRTPVSGIQATLEQAVSRPRTAENLRERVTEALALTTDMGATINSLLRLARLRGRIELVSREPFDPDAEISGILAGEAARDAAGHGIDFTPRTTPETFDCDIGLFHVLAGNLIENAFRHSPPGTTIQVRTSGGGRSFVLAVTNRGDELDPADAERIFCPFQRGGTASVDYPGSGLGLALANEIALLLGGGITVTFGEDGTVTFSATLPAAR